MNTNSTALTKTQPAALAQPAAFDPANVPAEVMQLAVALWASLKDRDGNNAITQADALKAAIHAERTGEVFGRDSYIGTEGKVKGQILEGYRAIQARIETPYIVKYRALTAEENTDHGITPGTMALMCEVYVLDVWRRAQKMNVPYAPVLGLGIITKADRTMYNGGERPAPTGKTWRWVLEKRARKDALRQLPAWARDPYDWQDDDDNGENGHTRALADANAAAHAQRAELNQLPPDELQAKRAAHVNTMRGGPKSDDPLGIDEPPTGPDIVEGEIVEPPAPRAAILDRLRRQAQEQPAPADERLIAIANGHLRCLVNGDDAKRKALLWEIFNLESSKQLTIGQANTLIAWIAARPQRRDENGKGLDYVPTGPALTQSEYSLLFPPEQLFDEAVASRPPVVRPDAGRAA